MAITTINIGNAPNDGSGDSVRVAFNKANQNFIELQTRIGNLATSGGTTGLQVNGPVELTSIATPALFTGTFRLRATAQDPYFDIATTAQGFQGGPVSGITTFTNAQDSTSPTTGAVVVAGGLGVSGTATLATADILGNINIFRLNMSAGGEMFLPDGSPLGNISANLGAYQAWANLTLSTVANAVNQQQAIDTLTSNASTQSIAISDLNANLGVIHLGNLSTQANLGAYQAWANLTLSTVANAVNQQQAIDNLNANLGTVVGTTIPALDANVGTLFLGNASTNANLGAYQSYGNLTFQTITAFNTLDANVGTIVATTIPVLDANLGTVVGTTIPALDANLGTVVGTTIPALDANLGTVVGTTIPALDANLGTVVGTTIPALDANIGTLFLGNVSTNANVGAYQEYANANVGTLFLGNLSTNANLGAYQSWANLNLAPLTDPVFTSNVDISSGGNLLVRNGATATFGGNLDVGSIDALAEANLTVRNGTIATFGDRVYALSNIYLSTFSNLVSSGNIVTNSNITLESGANITAYSGANVNIVAGANIHVPIGTEFNVFGGNVAVYKTTRIAEYPWPNNSKGANGDLAGMVAFDTNLNTLLICVANYDGTTDIWANVAAPRTTW